MARALAERIKASVRTGEFPRCGRGGRQHRRAGARLVRGIDRGFRYGEFVTPSEKAKAAGARVAFTRSAATAAGERS